MAYQIEFHAMGTQILVDLDSSEPDASVLKQVPVWFEAWEQTLSRFRPDSELNQFNQSSGKPFKMSQTCWEVMELSIQVENETEGLVTPTILQSLEMAGYDRSFDGLPSDQEGPVFNGSQFGTLSETVIFNQNEQIALLPPGLRIDFGGVAKGWAVQQAMLRLAKYGPVMVNGGGDIAISQPLKDGSPWPIGVENPFNQDEEQILFSVTSGGIATSGRNRRKWMKNGQWQHHLIDPRLSMPAESDVMTATVIAPDVQQAEMATKVIFLLGSREGLTWLQARPEMAALIYKTDGQLIQSDNMESYILRQEWTETL